MPTNQKKIGNCKPTIDANVLRNLIVEWIVDRCHAFNEIETKSFRRIIEYLNLIAVNKLSKKSDTIRADTIRYFKKAKTTIKGIISTARG